MGSSDLDISEEDRLAIEKLIVDAGLLFSSNLARGGWIGGRIWLVPTYKPIDEWKHIAEKHLVGSPSDGAMAGGGCFSTDTHHG